MSPTTTRGDIPPNELLPSALVGLGVCVGAVITATLLISSGFASFPAAATVIALCGVMIAGLQWNTSNVQARTAREQAATAKQQAETSAASARQQADASAAGLKLQLFERRYEVYKAADSIVAGILAASLTQEQELEYFRKIAPATFLFDAPVMNYLVQHLHNKLAVPFLMNDYIVKTATPGSAEVGEAMRERVKLMMTMGNESVALAEIFRPYLQMPSA
jgi:hypothetical protein